jgi:hypothetical protein
MPLYGRIVWCSLWGSWDRGLYGAHRENLGQRTVWCPLWGSWAGGLSGAHCEGLGPEDCMVLIVRVWGLWCSLWGLILISTYLMNMYMYLTPKTLTMDTRQSSAQDSHDEHHTVLCPKTLTMSTRQSSGPRPSQWALDSPPAQDPHNEHQTVLRPKILTNNIYPELVLYFPWKYCSPRNENLNLLVRMNPWIFL